MLFPSVKHQSKKDLAISAQRSSETFGNCSSTVGFIIGLHVCFPLSEVYLHFLLVTLNVSVLRLVQVVEGNMCSVLSCSPDVVVEGRVGVYSEHMPARSRTFAPSLYSVVDILGLYNHKIIVGIL